MATARLLLCIFCLAFTGRDWSADSSVIGRRDEAILTMARTQLGIREKTGKNDGTQVEAYLASVGLKAGQPWCAAFISWVFKQGGFSAPRTGWSPALFPPTRLVKTGIPGTVFSIYIPSLKRIGHCGLVETAHHDYIGSIEGNTNIAGSRDGDGVYRRIRHLKTIHGFSDWRSAPSNKKGGKS